MLHVPRPFPVLRASALLGSCLLAACTESPPASVVEPQIRNAVLDSNRVMFDGASGGAEVVSLRIGSWTMDKEPVPEGMKTWRADWTASLRFAEPIACILARIDGTNVVKVAADGGEELAFRGNATASSMQGEWHAHASVASDGDFTGPGTWKPIWEKVGGVRNGYQVVDANGGGGPKFRTVNFEPVSKLRPYAIEGSPEHRQLEAKVAERMQKAQADAAERAAKRQQALDEQRRQQQLAAEEQQKKRAEDAARLAAENAEKQRVAAAAAAAKLEADRRARLLAVLNVFRSPAGAVITQDAGIAHGTVIVEATIDEPGLAVQCRAVDCRTMPFQELTLSGSVDARGSFALTSSRGGDPVVYGVSGDKLVSRSGTTIAALTAADRATADAQLALGKRLGAAAPVTLTHESLDAEACKAREPQLALTGLPGTVFYRGKPNAAVAPLFAADLAAAKPFAWRNKDVVSNRLAAASRGSALYLRGAPAASTELVLTINGVHQLTIPAIPKLGGVLVALPNDLDVLELRLEATGAVSVRTIGLVR
jgi:hypothetical protein